MKGYTAVKVNMAVNLSSRFHTSVWFKGAYIQVDKLLMLKSALIDTLMKSFTIKTGDYEPDYGDRSGSHYFYVMENTSATASNKAWSGMYNPMFTEEVRSIMINPFLTYRGLEFFGTFETAVGF